MGGIKTNIKDLGKSFQKLKIILDLENKVSADTSFGFAILNAIENKKPVDEILIMIFEQYKDNSRIVTEIVGEKIMEKIIEIYQ